MEGEKASLSCICLMLLANWDNTGAQPPSRFPSEVPSFVVCRTFQVFPHCSVEKHLVWLLRNICSHWTSGFNYCPRNLNGHHTVLIDFISTALYLWSVTDKWDPCLAGTLITAAIYWRTMCWVSSNDRQPSKGLRFGIELAKNPNNWGPFESCPWRTSCLNANFYVLSKAHILSETEMLW